VIAATRPRELEEIRIPGLFFRSEAELLRGLADEFRFEDHGRSADGTPLVAIYCRHSTDNQEETGS
jgi:hypothetical protein